MEVTKFWTKPKLIILGSVLLVIGIVVAIVLIHRSNLRKEFIGLEEKINTSVVANHLSLEKIELKDDEYKEINIQALYKSHAMSGTYDDRCEGYVIVEKSTKKEGIVSKTYLKCGSIYTTEGYGTKSTKIENKTIAQSDNDTEPPKIKLNGEETITIGLDEKYVDKGAIAVDNVDSEVKVKTSGKVDTSKEGTYTITYTATDKAGNKATAERKVIVKKGAGSNKNDTTPPNIVFRNDSTYQNVCLGNKVDISKDGVYGYIASDDVDGDVTNNVKIEGNTGDATQLGKFTLTYKVKDKAGNEGIATRDYTVIDCSAPEPPQPVQPVEPDPEPPYQPPVEPDPPSGGGGGGGSSEPSGTVEVLPTGISVDDTVYVSVNGTVNLNASVIPGNASNKSLSYSVSNSSIATVDGSGNVRGIRAGETRVTISTFNNKQVGVYIIVE